MVHSHQPAALCAGVVLNRLHTTLYVTEQMSFFLTKTGNEKCNEDGDHCYTALQH